jgi:hypothetical protein
MPAIFSQQGELDIWIAFMRVINWDWAIIAVEDAQQLGGFRRLLARQTHGEGFSPPFLPSFDMDFGLQKIGATGSRALVICVVWMKMRYRVRC